MEGSIINKLRIINTLHGQNISDGIIQSTAGSSFIYFLRDGIAFLSNSFFKFLTAPLAIFIAVVDIIFAWRLFYLEKTGFTLTNAIVHTATSLALLTAAIGLTIGASIFAVIAPILFVAALGLQCLYQTGTAIYFNYKARTSGYCNDKDAFLRTSQEATANAILAGILAAVSTALLFVVAPVAQTLLASVALATTLAAVIYCGVKAYRLSSAKVDIEQHKTDLYSTAIISTELGIPRDLSFDGFAFELPTLPEPDANATPITEMDKALHQSPQLHL